MSSKSHCIVLSALQPSSSKGISARRAAQRTLTDLKEIDLSYDVFVRGMLYAIQDMRSLVGHVRALLDGPFADRTGIKDWLVHLDDVLQRLDQSFIVGRISGEDHLTIDDEGPADLDNALQLPWESGDQEWPEEAEFQLLSRLIEYWIDETQKRGYMLFHLLIGADDIVGAGKSLAKINEIGYPVS